MASGLLQLRGVGGLFGWKWLFIVDGIITLFVAVATWYNINPRKPSLHSYSHDAGYQVLSARERRSYEGRFEGFQAVV